jgi:hypothetical protein
MRFSALILLFAVALAAACSRSSPVPPYDSKKAQNALFLALDAWKQNCAGTLAKGTPPLRFEDEDYRAGSRLTEYRLEDGQLPIRPSVDVWVKLFLVDPLGKTFERRVTYQIGLEPALVVLRND